jgi:hypothetical protein
MPRERDHIPAGVARILRQEAGFGCCACGFPIFEYQHIVPWSVEHHDRPEDMMILCPNHHAECTRGALPEAQQRAWKANPYNIERGYVDGLLRVEQTYCAVDCGSCQLVNDGIHLIVDNEPLLSLRIEDHRMLLSLKLYGEQDRPLVTIEDNEWTSGDPTVWDLEAGFRTLTLRQKSRDVRLRVDARKEPMKLMARLVKAGYKIELGHNGIFVDGRERGRGVARIEGGCLVGWRLNVSTETGGLWVTPDPRYGRGESVSGPDRLSRIINGINKLAEFRREAGLDS